MNEVHEFELTGHEFIELNKLLKFMGVVDTGGEANSVIDSGVVTVNDATETQKRKKLRKGDVIILENITIKIV